MRRLHKLMALIIVVATIVCNFSITFAEEFDLNTIIAEVSGYIYNSVPNPICSSVGGEWAVVGLARGDFKADDEYYKGYFNEIKDYLKKNNGVLTTNKYTEYSRVVLAINAIGQDAKEVGGYNLIEYLTDVEKVKKQGVNGPAWALIALQSVKKDADIQFYENEYLEYILKSQLEDGGWSLAANSAVADADVTAMTLVALCGYKDIAEVKTAIDSGVEALSNIQSENGGFLNNGIENCESSAQAIVAMSTLGISLDDSRFIKNGKTVLDSLMSYYKGDGAFSHTLGGEEDLMASEQSLCAIVSLWRSTRGMNSLYSMQDAVERNFESDGTEFGIKNRDKDVKMADVKYSDRAFEDVIGHSAERAITELASRGIINGKSEEQFDPNSTMTRAEFAAIVVRALGLEKNNGSKFVDVSDDDWFFEYVNTACFYGIVNGISETEFNPNGTITNEEAAVMVARASKLCGIDTELGDEAVRNVLAGFIDYIKVSDWARKSLAMCFECGIMDNSVIEIKPDTHITRAEVAQLLYNMLGKAELL